jgi:stress response protein YsnF
MPSDEQAADTGLADTIVIPLAAEQAEVSKRTVPVARVTVRTVTEERDEVIDVPVATERVEITRVPMDRIVDSAPPIQEQGDVTIIPVVEEVIVVERRLRVKEEIHLRRVRTSGCHHETVKVRAQTVDVARTPAEPDTEATRSPSATPDADTPS